MIVNILQEGFYNKEGQNFKNVKKPGLDRANLKEVEKHPVFTLVLNIKEEDSGNRTHTFFLNIKGNSFDVIKNKNNKNLKNVKLNHISVEENIIVPKKKNKKANKVVIINIENFDMNVNEVCSYDKENTNEKSKWIGN